MHPAPTSVVAESVIMADSMELSNTVIRVVELPTVLGTADKEVVVQPLT